MSRTHKMFPVLLIPALALAGCGGDGGGGGAVQPLPPPPTSPPPPPPPPPPPSGSGLETVALLGSPQDGKQAVLGLENAGTGGASLTSTGFSVSYDSANKRYLMDFPSTQSGYFYHYSGDSPNSRYWTGTLAAADKSGPHDNVTVLKPSNSEITLTYTTSAFYNTLADNKPFGFVAFGSATPSSAIPTSGSATYTARIDGQTVDRAAAIRGTASLAFDFGAGTLSGSMSPTYSSYNGMGESSSLGQYSFVDTVFSKGSTSFSGKLSNPAASGLGSFMGLFTGPNAQELMSSWSAPFVLNGQSGQMFGVWVGKKN